MEDEKITITVGEYKKIYQKELELHDFMTTIFEFASLDYDKKNLIFDYTTIRNWLKTHRATAYKMKVELLKERKEKEK